MLKIFGSDANQFLPCSTSTARKCVVSCDSTWQLTNTQKWSLRTTFRGLATGTGANLSLVCPTTAPRRCRSLWSCWDEASSCARMLRIFSSCLTRASANTAHVFSCSSIRFDWSAFKMRAASTLDMLAMAWVPLVNVLAATSPHSSLKVITRLLWTSRFLSSFFWSCSHKKRNHNCLRRRE